MGKAPKCRYACMAATSLCTGLGALATSAHMLMLPCMRRLLTCGAGSVYCSACSRVQLRGRRLAGRDAWLPNQAACMRPTGLHWFMPSMSAWDKYGVLACHPRCQSSQPKCHNSRLGAAPPDCTELQADLTISLSGVYLMTLDEHAANRHIKTLATHGCYNVTASSLHAPHPSPTCLMRVHEWALILNTGVGPICC